MSGVQRPNPCFLDGMVKIGAPGGRPRWRSPDGTRLYEWDSLHGDVEVYNERGYCLRPTHAPIRPKEDSRTILDRMLWRHERGASAQNSIAGFVGAAFSVWPPSSVEEAYALLRQRLMQPDLDWLTRDREFDKFIAAKAYELVARRRSK